MEPRGRLRMGAPVGRRRFRRSVGQDMTATKIFISYAHDDAEIAIRIVEAIRTTGHQVWIDIEQIAWGQSFLSRMAEGVAAVPVEQVVGSSIATKYESQGGKPVLMREPKVFFIDDKDGKAIGINLFIGKRPYAAFGNSGGDREMLEWTGAGDGARLKMLVLHDDAEREYAYGPANGLPDTKVGTFSQALADEAKQKGWVVISMKNDWKTIFPETPK
jgi:TIR domain